jgi:hypothetical protein
MGIPKLPGNSFAYMRGLILKNNHLLSQLPFDPELVLAIFWEETLFNNIFQADAGTGVGFGQTEPYEFYRFDARYAKPDAGPAMRAAVALAVAHGYVIDDLPPVLSLGPQRARSLRPLSDDLSVRVTLSMMLDLHYKGANVLLSYAGYGFHGPQPPHLSKAGARQEIVNNWLRCAGQIQAAMPTYDYKRIVQALKIARAFNDEAGFTKVLFPLESSGVFG